MVEAVYLTFKLSYYSARLPLKLHVLARRILSHISFPISTCTYIGNHPMAHPRKIAMNIWLTSTFKGELVNHTSDQYSGVDKKKVMRTWCIHFAAAWWQPPVSQDLVTTKVTRTTSIVKHMYTHTEFRKKPISTFSFCFLMKNRLSQRPPVLAEWAEFSMGYAILIPAVLITYPHPHCKYYLAGKCAEYCTQSRDYLIN